MQLWIGGINQMRINNKEFGEWTADDLQALLSNDAYRENNFIDYKVNFAPLLDKNNKKEKQAEFRNDVCSFANADGGYIFYGIGETSGVASILAGISIPNIDHFELDRRNELQAIRPTVPDVTFSFISLQDDKYIVVLHIQRGLYKPYITEEPEGQFHFYIRHGNKKQAMLSEDIKSFRKKRLEEHITEMKKLFALVQLIPATFRSDCVPMYDLYREGKLNFDDLFNDMIYDRAVPNVDGIYFPDYSEQRDFEQLQIFNNGAVELKMDFQIRKQNLRSQQLKTERYLIIFDFEAELRKLIQGTSQMYQKLGRSTAMYVCVTIVGCKGLWNYTVNAYGANTPTKVDRNQIVCTPIEIRNIQDDVQVKEGIENCIRMTKYSLGIRM
jgi:hypothetical protein